MIGSNGIVRISVRTEDFHVDFGETFRMVFFAALFLVESFFLLTGNSTPLLMVIILPTLVAVLCMTIVAPMVLRFKFEIGPEGIDCFDIWCRPHRTPWSAVQECRVIKFLGLAYLRVVVRDSRRAIWLPLFVRRYDLLRDLLISYAPAEHHLDIALPTDELRAA